MADTPYDSISRRATALPPCDRPASTPSTGTREWRVPDPWRSLRLPDDFHDVAGLSSEDAPRRAFQTTDADTLEVFFLPSIASAQEALGADPVTAMIDGVADLPGFERESQCGGVFAAGAMIVTRSSVTMLGETALYGVIVAGAPTGAVILATITTDSIARREQVIAAFHDLASREQAPAPRAEPGAMPRLAVRFHPEYHKGQLWVLTRPARRDASWAEKEARDAIDHYAFERIRGRWYMPKEVDPEHIRVHEEEVREYADDVRAHRADAPDQQDRHARSTMPTFVIENSGDVVASDVRVKLTFPPHLVVGSFGTIFAPRLEAPEPPRIFEVGPGFLKQRRRRMNRTLEIGNLEAAAREDTWDSYEKRPDGSVTVTYRVDRINPRSAPNLTKACVMFPRWEDVLPVAIAWEVTASGAAATHGTLQMPVRVRTAAEEEAEMQELAMKYRSEGKLP